MIRRHLPILALLLLSGCAHAQVLVDYATESDQLAQALAGQNRPLAVAVGHFKMAPVHAEVRCVTADLRADWFDAHSDESCTEVVVLSETSRATPTSPTSTDPAARAPERRRFCPTSCDGVDLALEEVTCNPPHGGGYDGRVWVHLTCGASRAPFPYDWQLAELSGNRGFIFAWNADPSYAYVEGEFGTYQAGAVTQLGEVNLVFKIKPSPRPGGCGRPPVRQ